VLEYQNEISLVRLPDTPAGTARADAHEGLQQIGARLIRSGSVAKVIGELMSTNPDEAPSLARTASDAGSFVEHATATAEETRSLITASRPLFRA
jgi:hypothetical protein